VSLLPFLYIACQNKQAPPQYKTGIQADSVLFYSEIELKQLKDKSKSQTHTCPYDVATKGELAIYCLQGIFKTNFYNLTKEPALSDENLYKKYGNSQNWVWHIQNTKREIEELQRLWKSKLEHNQ
jgi:hypothetical protein